MQMDFYVPTEHNVIHTGWKHTEVMIVPGVEVTAEKGTVIFLELTDFRPESKKSSADRHPNRQKHGLRRFCRKQQKEDGL